MAHVLYDNFFLSNEVEDQFNSHLDLAQFCTIDRTLEGVAGMVRKINVYRATNGTEKLAMGEGNSKSIEVSYTPEEYRIQLAQNRFDYYDEQAMTDPNLVPVGVRHMGTDMFNTVNADVFAEFNKTSVVVNAPAPDFAAFVDAQAALNIENIEGVSVFGFVSIKDMAKVRKALKDDLKYVEAFAKQGYVGTVGGVNLYTKKDAVEGEIIVGTKDAVKLFIKKGTEVEQPQRAADEANVRQNSIFARKYYVAALTNETKAVKIKIGA